MTKAAGQSALQGSKFKGSRVCVLFATRVGRRRRGVSVQVFGFAAIQERVSIVLARQNKTADNMVFSVLIKKFSDTAYVSEMIINR